MRLFLIRHAESVDNVAGVYAGARDAPLTAHGVLQARRLASSLARASALTHAFSSPLQRAAKTAEAVRDAQSQATLGIVLVPELREKAFGSLEGVSYRAARADGSSAGGDAETNQAMRERSGRFLDEHILPLLHREVELDAEAICAVVAHGIILNALVRVLLERFPQVSLEEVSPTPQPGRVATALPGPALPSFSWSNTGYLEARISRRPSSQASLSSKGTDCSPWLTHIERVNCTSHLANLTKTRGGIGSAPFDERQRTLNHFFTPASKEHGAS